MEGIFIPKEFFKIKELNPTECVVLAIYKYYTEKGNNKYCSLNNTQIAELLNVSTRYLRMVKTHLKQLGYIRTDGGIKVTYVGIKGDIKVTPEVKNSSPQVGSTVPQVGSTVPQVGSTVPTDRKYSSYQVGSTVPIKQEVYFLHKKEKKEIKKNKKEEKEKLTNFDLLLGRLSDDYLTPEKIDYMEKHYKDRINELDIDNAILESWVINIKNELNKQYPMEFKVEKKEQVNDYFDL